MTHAVDWYPALYHLIGLVVKASASREEDPRFESRVESYQ